MPKTEGSILPEEREQYQNTQQKKFNSFTDFMDSTKEPEEGFAEVAKVQDRNAEPRNFSNYKVFRQTKRPCYEDDMKFLKAKKGG